MRQDHQHLVTYPSEGDVRIDRIIDQGPPELYTVVPSASFADQALGLGEALLLDSEYGRRKLEHVPDAGDERALYENLRSLHDRLGSSVNRLHWQIEVMPDVPDREVFREALGQVMSGLFDLLMPIIRRYPDLDPDKQTSD